MFKWFFCVAVGVVCCVASPGFAADRAPQKEAGKRERKVSSAERAFKKVDFNRDGKITLDEFKVFYDREHALGGPAEAAAPARNARPVKPQKAARHAAQPAESSDPAARCPVWQGQQGDAKVPQRNAGVH